MTPPTRYALVPVEATQRMCRALADDFEWDAARDSFQAGYTAMLAASQNAGCVTAPQRTEAATAAYICMFPDIAADTIVEHFDWYDCGKADPRSSVHYSNVAKAYRFADMIIGALGLQVADVPAGEVVDGETA